MLSLSDQLTVPQVFLNDTHIGGADDTMKLVAKWDMEESPITAYITEVKMRRDPIEQQIPLHCQRSEPSPLASCG